MLRKGLLLVLGGCFLGATATRADDVGYVDCTNHPEATQVLGKAAKTQEVVAAVPCGERFTILQSGYFFTRIQTQDGKVGFVHTNEISRDYAGNVAPQPAPAPRQAPPTNAEVKTAARSSNPFSAIAGAFRPKQSAPPQSLRIPPPPTPAPAAKASANQPGIHGVTIAEPTATTQAAANVPAPAPAATPSAADRNVLFPAKTSIVIQSETSTTAAADAAKTQPSVSAAVAPPANASIPDTTVAVVQPEPSRVVQPEPEPAQPSVAEPQPAAFRASDRAPFEKSAPRGSGRRFPLIELFGGFSFARLDGGAGTFTNMTGGMGSFGLNITPWLQITGDSSYNMIQSAGTKTVLYGNHYGPRLYHRGRNRWGISPFVEALAGGSRVDTTISGASGYTTSDRAFSFKVGGGVDIRPSRYLEIRLINVDYYRTGFGGGSLQQNNYWASTGVVLRLLGGSAE